jgi:hypothetical protein
MKRPFVIGLAGFLVLVLALYAQMYSGLKHQENVIAGLESELATAREQLKNLQDSHRSLTKSLESKSELSLASTGGASVAQALMPAAPLGGQRAPEERAERSALWRAQQFVEEVEEDLALTPEQKEALSQAYKSELGTTVGTSDDARMGLMEKVLGAEVARVYREKQVQAEERERTERINSQAIVLARKLSLSPEQEVQVREALAQIELSIRPKSAQVRVVMREAMANHMGGDEAKEQLKQQYEAIKQLNTEIKTESDKALFEAIGPALTDEQKNALLALQAEKRS